MSTPRRPARPADADAGDRLSPAVVELHALIEAALIELAAHLDVAGDLIDTRQAPTVPFLTPEARKARDQAIVAERDARLVSAKLGVKIPGETPAPLNIAVVSIESEARTYLLEVVAELHDELHRAGVCWVGETWWHDGFYQRTRVDEIGVYLARLVHLVRRPARLRPIHQRIEDLTNRAKRVVDGEHRHRLPEPCPHCRRHTLVVDTVRWVTRCEEDLATGQLEPCECPDPFCPCHSTRTDFRHSWDRRGGSKDSFYGLAHAQRQARLDEENDMHAQAALDRIRNLHTTTWTDAAGDEHTHTTLTHLPAPVDHECTDGCVLEDDYELHQVPACVECLHLTDAGAEYVLYPCPTIRAIDDPDQADDNTDRSN